ncbi:MAG: ribose 5-phosphate isomerase B [Saprospiraceae bacterium]|nr:ribose 5-phosphate isomerase B [Saprospiraceae bacterium]MCB9308749.1 ribose 5-phosphate isomerase B [Lewinellaceae bacterium]
MSQTNPIILGSDHAGFEWKESIHHFLKHNGYKNIIDVGTFDAHSVDYPDYAHAVASQVASSGDSAYGILLCGSGNGVCISANKHAGIRAALCWNDELAALARKHNNANIVCIPARFVSKRKARSIVKAFLTNEFEGGRHQKRVEKIDI